MRIKYFIFFLCSCFINGQSINVNDNYSYSLIRNSVLKGNINTNYSLNIKPLQTTDFETLFKNEYHSIFKNKSELIEIKSLGIDYFVEYNSHHPYNRNNGTMIPNRGYQHIVSPGLFIKAGPLNIQLKPEHHYSENKNFDGFWDGHYPEIWAKRYSLWNHIDMPERFGNKRHNKTTLGQSSIKLNWKNFSIGLSNENIWWGPSIRNSIMMSNHAQGFKHLTFNSIRPLKTFIGSFEFQLISARLESSGFNPPRTDYEYAGTKLFVPKINQFGATDDWRYLQAINVSYSPKWIDGFSIGFIRWVQMYSALVEGKYSWIEGSPTYFPIFQNMFRKNDQFPDYEAQTNQAAGFYFKWLWKESKAEIYMEYHLNDAKQNIRDFLLDTDHSRAATIGIQKIFKISSNDILFSWEWTQMEQTASSLIRNAGYWYEHGYVYDGYTNRGEVLGSSIGPGSNSHFVSLNILKENKKLGVGLEIIDNDNDFYHQAFASAYDYRRYWKDINFHFIYDRKFKDFKFSGNLVFIRSLNYQWELDDFAEPYYHPGRDVDNFHLNFKLTYFINWKAD